MKYTGAAKFKDDIKKPMKDKQLNSNSMVDGGSKLLQFLFN